MRISTSGVFQRGLNLMQQLQAALDRTQQQISSGRRILHPSDDPISSLRALELKETLSRLTQFERNGIAARNRLSLEETALVSVNDVLQRVRELALQARNPTQSNESRSLIAIEIRQQVDQLVQIANQRDGNGRFLFGGNMDNTTPVDRASDVFSYNGDQGQRLIQIGETRQIADGDSGSDVFFMIRNGNGTFFVNAPLPNTGSGIIGAGSLVDPTQFDQDQYTIQFVDPDNYNVLDSSATVIASGTFQSGNSIAFRGIEFTLEGLPAAGDEFVVSPSRFQDVFTTIDRLATTLQSGANDDVSRAAMNNGINAGHAALNKAAVNDRTEPMGER